MSNPSKNSSEFIVMISSFPQNVKVNFGAKKGKKWQLGAKKESGFSSLTPSTFYILTHFFRM